MMTVFNSSQNFIRASTKSISDRISTVFSQKSQNPKVDGFSPFFFHSIRQELPSMMAVFIFLSKFSQTLKKSIFTNILTNLGHCQ